MTRMIQPAKCEASGDIAAGLTRIINAAYDFAAKHHPPTTAVRGEELVLTRHAAQLWMGRRFHPSRGNMRPAGAALLERTEAEPVLRPRASCSSREACAGSRTTRRRASGRSMIGSELAVLVNLAAIWSGQDRGRARARPAPCPSALSSPTIALPSFPNMPLRSTARDA